jgi:hypothetical protein
MVGAPLSLDVVATAAAAAAAWDREARDDECEKANSVAEPKGSSSPDNDIPTTPPIPSSDSDDVIGDVIDVNDDISLLILFGSKSALDVRRGARLLLINDIPPLMLLCNPAIDDDVPIVVL